MEEKILSQERFTYLDSKEVKFLMELSKRVINGNEYYSIRCLGANDKVMGYVNYTIKKDTLWLIMVETYGQYRSRGIGTALLQVMEVEGAKEGCRCINGKYYPKNTRKEDEDVEIHAMDTYLKLGYSKPTSEDDWFLSKWIDRDEVREYDSRIKHINNEKEVIKKR